jgi:hypothetical protein
MAHIQEILGIKFGNYKFTVDEIIPTVVDAENPDILIPVVNPSAEQLITSSYPSLVWYPENAIPAPTLEEILTLSAEVDFIIARSLKKEEVRGLRQLNIWKPLLARTEDGINYYAETAPEKDLFESGQSMSEDETIRWGCYIGEQVDGKVVLQDKKILLRFTKSEILSLANHYRQRKNQEYVLCDMRRAAIDELTTIEQVQNYDITQVYVD